jgi:hypothetical protein
MVRMNRSMSALPFCNGQIHPAAQRHDLGHINTPPLAGPVGPGFTPSVGPHRFESGASFQEILSFCLPRLRSPRRFAPWPF